MNRLRRRFVCLSIMTAVSLVTNRLIHALDPNRPDRFLSEERRAIEDYYRALNDKKRQKKGLPPGLAKRGGNLPPGLQKKVGARRPVTAGAAKAHGAVARGSRSPLAPIAGRLATSRG